VSISDGAINLFADDTELHVCGATPDDVASQLSSKLQDLRRYLASNKLELNVEKSAWMLMFGDSNSTNAVRYGSRIISRVNSYKYLGFVIDTNLNWKMHVNAVVSKVKRRLYCLRRSRYSVSRGGRMMLLKALVMPYFNYGIELWFASSKTTRGTLEILLRHCLRIISNDVELIPTISNLDLYVSLDVLPLSLLFQQRLGQMMFKALKLRTCPAVKRLLLSCELASTDVSLRSRELLRTPFTRQECCRARLLYYGCRFWNQLHCTFRDCYSESNFVSTYRAYLMDCLMEGADLCPSKFYDYV
jgi:hypothetical protein